MNQDSGPKGENEALTLGQEGLRRGDVVDHLEEGIQLDELPSSPCAVFVLETPSSAMTRNTPILDDARRSSIGLGRSSIGLAVFRVAG